jgi:elongation of very long chain fatty acids protein 6
MAQQSWIPIVACLAYGAAILGGQAYFRTRPRWHWRNTLAVWNATLSLFSLLGLVRTLPQLVHNLSTASLADNLCADPQTTYGSGSTGLWVQLFILSKFPYVDYTADCGKDAGDCDSTATPWTLSFLRCRCP